ncbi:MAG: aminotransferase class IV [Campylobacterota bacterium]
MFFETIKAFDKQLYHLHYHQKRVDKTLRDFGAQRGITLEQHIDVPHEKLVKVKVIYDLSGVLATEYEPYTRQNISSFNLVQTQMDYRYKYLDRAAFETTNGANEEIVYVKNGLITDTSIANIAVYDGQKWLTPRTPLLQGTTRARYLDKGLLHLADINLERFKTYSTVALMNAMVDFYQLKNFEIKGV